MRRLLIWLGILLALLLVLCIGAYLFLMSWLRGDGFRSYLTTAMQQTSGAAEVSIPQNMVVDGSHMTLPECALKQAPLFHELRLRKLHLDVNRPALLQRWLRFRHLSAEELQLTLSTAAAEQPAARPAAPPAPATAEPAQAAAATGSSAPAAAPPVASPAALHTAISRPGSSFLKGVQLTSFESHYTTTTLLTGHQANRSFSLSGYHLTITPKRDTAQGTWLLNLENGRILTPFNWLRECGLKSAKILYSPESIRLSEARVLLTPGDLRFTGEYTPLTGRWKADADISQASVARLLNEDWRKRLTGRLNGQLHCTGQHPGAWQAKGQLRLDSGRLEGLPILSEIKLGGTRPYRTLTLEKASCTISYPYAEPQHGIADAWLWDNIDIRATDGNLLIRGRIITGMDGSLAGALDIGLPVRVLAELGLSQSPAVAQLFNAPVKVPGYVWLRVNLSGTVSAPQEDLSVRLATILPQALPGLAEQTVNSLGSVLSSFLPEKEQPAPAKPDSSAPQPKPAAAPQPLQPIQNAIQSGLDMIF